MGDHANYSTSELLHLYLDGELESVLEPVLFRAIADDQDLRSELRESLFIRSVFHGDGTHLYPPPALKDTLISSLGLEATPAQTLSLGTASGAQGLLSKAAMPLCSAVLASLLTALLFLNWNRGDMPSEEVTTVASSLPERVNETSTRDSLPPRVEDVPIARSPALQKRDEYTIHSQQIRSKAGPLRKTPQAQPMRIHTPAEVIRTRPITPRIELTDSSVVLRDNDYKAPVQSIADGMQTEETGDWTIQLRGFASSSFPAPRTESGSTSWFNNIGAALFYRISAQHRIGIEAGQEPFSQIFREYENGQRMRYEQNPVLQWAGAAYQFRPERIEWMGEVQPFAQMLAGATSLGALGRAAIGLEYSPESRVSIMLGVDGALLLYKSSDRWYTTRKLGITYGTSITF